MTKSIFVDILYIESNFVLQNTGGGVDEEYLQKQFESVNKQFEETKALLGQLGGKTEGRSDDTLKLEIKLAEETKAKEDLQSRLGKETLAKINLEKRIQSLQVWKLAVVHDQSLSGSTTDNE